MHDHVVALVAAQEEADVQKRGAVEPRMQFSRTCMYMLELKKLRHEFY